MSMTDTAAPAAALPSRFSEAVSLLDDGNFEEALVVCEQILAENTACPEALMLLGLISFELDEPVQALDLLTRAHEMSPGISDYAEALASIQARLGDTTEALFLTKIAMTLDPHPSGTKILPAKYANFFENLESASPDKFRKRAERLFGQGDIDGAEAAAEMQLRLTPGDPETLRLLADIWRATGKLTAAISAMHAVLHTAPRDADRSLLAALLAEAGRHDEAARTDLLALRTNTHDHELTRSRLINLSHDPDRSVAEIAAARHDWHDRFATVGADQATTARPPSDAERAGRQFSIGLVGNSFGDPTTADMLAPVMAALENQGVSLLIYSDTDRRNFVSDRCSNHAKRWVDLAGVDPETAAEIMRGDGIDIAIDLAGYGDGCRFATFGWQPARLNIGWFGSLLPAAGALDWMLGGPETGIADNAPVPVWQLPETPLVYPAPPGLETPGVLPLQQNGFVTLGTALPLGAIGGATLALWSALLAAVPGSRLLVANVARLDDECVARAYDQISHAGLRQLVDIVDLEDAMHVDLDFWRHVDIAIDPQPIGSFSRTSRALWSGVPTIALRGSRFAGRAGAGALRAAGKADWIANDVAGASAILRSLIADRNALAGIREALPADVAASPLADPQGLATAMINAFGEMLALRAGR